MTTGPTQPFDPNAGPPGPPPGWGQPGPPPGWGQPGPPPGWQPPPGAPGGYAPAPYPPGYGYGPYGMPGGQPSNGLGTAALVLGIISVVSGIIPFLFWLAWILGILAVIFGAIGRGKAKRGEATNAGAALGGLITGIAGIVVGTLIFIFIVATFGRAARDISNDLTRYNNCLARNSGNPDRFTICNRG